MTGTMTTYAEFLTLHGNGGVVVRVSERAGARLWQSLGLPPDAPVGEVSIALDRLGRELRDREHGLRSVRRGERLG